MILCLLSGHILRLFLIMPDLKKCYHLIFSCVTPPKINMDTKHDALENVDISFQERPFSVSMYLKQIPKKLHLDPYKASRLWEWRSPSTFTTVYPPLTCAWVDQLPFFSFRDKLINIIVGFTMLYI